MANARYMLTILGFDAGESNATRLLAFAKERDCWLTSDEIRLFMGRETETTT